MRNPGLTSEHSDVGVADLSATGIRTQDDAQADIGRAALAETMRHPAFRDAMLAIARLQVEMYGGNWVLNRLLNDRGRVVASMMVLDLHFAAATPHGGGVTVAALREEATRHGFSSPRRMAAWAASVRFLGYLAPLPGNRPQRLVPTEAFLAMVRQRLRGVWQHLAPLYAAAPRAIAALERPAALGEVAHAFMDEFRRGQRLLHASPELVQIFDRDAGAVLMFSLLLGDAADRPQPMANLARRFMVSRTHVTSLMRAAEQTGLVQRGTRAGSYVSGPVLTDAMSRFFAALMRVHFHAMQRVLALHAGLA